MALSVADEGLLDRSSWYTARHDTLLSQEIPWSLDRMAIHIGIGIGVPVSSLVLIDVSPCMHIDSIVR